MVNDMIDVDRLRELQRIIAAMNIEPTTWEHFDIPQDLELAWKKFIEAKKEFNVVLKTYNIDPVA